MQVSEGFLDSLYKPNMIPRRTKERNPFLILETSVGCGFSEVKRNIERAGLAGADLKTANCMQGVGSEDVVIWRQGGMDNERDITL